MCPRFSCQRRWLSARIFLTRRASFPCGRKKIAEAAERASRLADAQKSLVQNLFAEIRENICGNTREYFRETENLFAEIRLRFCGNKFGGRGVGKEGQAFGFAGIIEQLQEVPKI